MYIKVMYNLNQFDYFDVEENRLTKKAKSEIKERIINSLEYKDLSTICKIRGSEIKRVDREVKKYLEKNRLDYSHIKSV